MKEKKLYCIVVFPSTTDAMYFEDEAKKNGLSGRIIPLPREISSGCGLSWKEDLDNRGRVEELLEVIGINYKGIYEILL